MKLKAAHVVFSHWRIIVYATFCIATAILLTVYSREVGLQVFDYIAQNQDRKLTSYLAQEEVFVSKQVAQLGSSESIRAEIKERDVPTLLDILDKEQGKGNLSAYTVTDAHGIALTRSPINANLGDDIFLTNPVGRSVAAGVTGTTYVPARNFPLTMASGVLVKDPDGATVGALFGGYWLDNAYAKSFKSKYLDDIRHREIIFYSKEEGVTGSSIEDAETKNKIRAYLSHASTLVQDGKSGDLLNMNGTDYVVTNHFFVGPDEIYGGALLLTPVPLTLFLRSLLLALAIASLFFISLLYFEKVSIPELLRFKKKTLYTMLFCLSATVFFSIWAGVYAYGQASTIHLDKPQFTIYNSTMSVRPDSGIYIQGYEQEGSIIISSGGEEINAIEAGLQFDPKIMSVDSLSFDRSVCSPETIVEQSIDNTEGTINISCAVTSKAFAEARGVLADIRFTPKKTGDAALVFDQNTHVYAADGLGTDVLRSTTSGFYRIFDEKDLSNFFSTKAVVIPYSPTHQNSSKWYSGRQVSVVWPKVEGAEYEYELSQDATSTMQNPTVTSLTSVTLTVPSDGVFYFKIAAKKGNMFGQVSRLKIRIDTTAPDTPTILASSLSIKKNDIVRFVLSSNDDGSGLQKNFYVRVDNSAWLPTNAKIYMPFHETGEHTFGVRVFDNAENYSDSYVTVKVRN
jgi:hypothetical protein